MKGRIVMGILVVVCGLPVPASAQQHLQVGPNVQVSAGLPDAMHYEMIIAADPAHGERLLACSMVWKLDEVNTVDETYASFDTGHTWKPTLETRGGRHHESWDPDCAYGPDGVAYSLSEGIDTLDRTYDRIARSNDGGRTWSEPAYFKHAERSFMSIDLSSGPRRGWMYVHGSGSDCVPGSKCLHGDGTRVIATPDGGRTIVGESEVPADSLAGNPFVGRGVVLTDGTAIMPTFESSSGWANLPLYDPLGVNRPPANGAVWVLRLTDARKNWPLTIEKSKVSEAWGEWQWNGSPLPYAAADLSGGPFKDRVYVTWVDHRFGKLDAMLAYSTDKGKTWSKPRVVNDDHRWTKGGGPDIVHPAVTVSPQGVVGVMWYDRRDQPDNLGWDVRFRASFDGGETFTPSVKVNTVSQRPLAPDSIVLMTGYEYSPPYPDASEFGVHSFHFSGGHTAGLAADASGAFHVLWADNRTGMPQMWTARVGVTGGVVVNGSQDLASLADASKSIILLVTRPFYHQKTGLIEATVALENDTKGDTVIGPVKVRVLDLRADAGTTTVTNADAGGASEGAVWDFTSLLPNGRLAPHDRTKTKVFTFHLAHPDAIRPFGPNAWVALAHFNTKVLAGRVFVAPDSAKAKHDSTGADPDGGSRGADPDGGRDHDPD